MATIKVTKASSVQSIKRQFSKEILNGKNPESQIAKKI